MKLEHTPGPWEWEGVDDREYCFDAHGLGPEVIELEDQFPGYAECGEDLIMRLSPADARLIVASPEMIEALIKVCRSGDVDFIYIEWLIEKATGKTWEELDA